MRHAPAPGARLCGLGKPPERNLRRHRAAFFPRPLSLALVRSARPCAWPPATVLRAGWGNDALSRTPPPTLICMPHIPSGALLCRCSVGLFWGRFWAASCRWVRKRQEKSRPKAAYRLTERFSFLLTAFEIAGARGRNRTGTVLPPADFESAASTDFATRAGVGQTSGGLWHSRSP